MGDYTGLRFKGTVKPEYRPHIDLLHKTYNWEDVLEYTEADENMTDIILAHILLGWLEFQRAGFIPFGIVCYLPKEWRKQEGSRFDVETGEWEFCCSLKNYNEEIEWFVKNLLPRLIYSYEYCESMFEYDSEPTKHIPLRS